MNKNDKIDKFYIYICFLIAISLISLVAVLSVYFYHFKGPLGDQAIFALFGDFVGGLLNPIFSFFTVMLLIGSLALQRVELRKMSEELELTREVHQSSLDMRHYEYLVNENTKDVSDLRLAAESFRQTFDERVTLDISTKEAFQTQHFSVFEVFSNDDLLRLIQAKGYLVASSKFNDTASYTEVEFETIIERLELTLVTMTGVIEQLKSLGCPKWRAKAVIDIGIELIEDYYSSSHASNAMRENLMQKISPFNKFKNAYLSYPDYP